MERERKLGNANKYVPLSALNSRVLILRLLSGACSVIISVNLKRHTPSASSA